MECPYTRCGPFLFPPCPAHWSLPGLGGYGVEPHVRHHRRNVMPRCPRQILAAVVKPVLLVDGPRSLISGALACELADSFQRSRGRHDEETHSANYASARRLLRVAIKTSKRRCWRLCDEVNNDVLGQTIQDCHVTPRDARRPSNPAPLLLVRGAVAALFPRGAERGPPCDCRVERRSSIPAVTLEELRGAQSRIKERSALSPDACPTWRSSSLLSRVLTSS
ncbi:unnamed protein product [Trichogramma brassicae]|uniref:Uncharacterized protein n=1 Tax=Trichogramma brassicae TaxID=86971 RepID=A0A6H5J4F2_9HYME|nr:unnamed protein product [Trichogramma brassicae]